ncbi:MAG TPA: O-antigen ligase family protein [Thermoanaerobaculia bacterium]|nr:O-antigen ligase family protein [Thermoanaerobaculia bacterium]
MPDRSHRTLLYHLLAIDLVVVALGLSYLFPESHVAMYAAFVLVVIASAWKGGEETGIAATAYSVAAMAIFFPAAVTPATLMGFAGAGAVISTFARVARRLRAREDGVAAPQAAMPDLTTVPFAVGLPALAVVMYTDLSDLLMENFRVPSMLQPLILLLAVAAWRARRTVHPFAAMLHPVTILFALYAIAVFSTTIFAKDVSLADHRFEEVVKAAIIAVVAASLAATWQSLRRALSVLVIAASTLATISVLQITTGRFYGILGGLLEPETGNIWGRLALPRAAGPPVSDPNAYARILLITIPVAVALAVAHRNRKLRIFFAIAALVTTAGTLVTYSRGAMLALGAMAVMLFFAMRGNVRQLATAAVAGVLALLLLPENITRRFVTVESLLPGREIAVEADNALEKRKLLVRAGIAMFDANPIAGVGAGNYSKHFVNFANVTGSSFMDYHRPGSVEHAHGLYFEAAAETGLAGLLTLTAALAAAVLTSWRTARALLQRGMETHAAIAAGLGVAVASYMIASVVLHESHLRYIGMFFGFVIAAARLAQSSAPDEALV